MLLLPDTRILNPFEKPSFEHTQRYGLDWQNAKVSLEGCVGYWLMNEGAGGRVFDLSGNGNKGTFAAGAASPTWVPGKFGSAISFDGGDYCEVTPKSIITTSQTGTLIIWLKADSLHLGTLYACADVGETDHWGLFIRCESDGTAVVFIRDASLVWKIVQGTDSAVYAANEWVMWSIVQDGVGVKFYKNEEQIGLSDAYGLTSTDLTAWLGDVADLDILRFGYEADSTPANYFNGSISHITQYNCPLSASEIALLNREPYCQVWKPRTQIVVGWVSGGAPSGIPILRRRRECA